MAVEGDVGGVPRELAASEVVDGGSRVASTGVEVTCPPSSATYGESLAGSAADWVRCSDASGVRYPGHLWGRSVL